MQMYAPEPSSANDALSGDERADAAGQGGSGEILVQRPEGGTGLDHQGDAGDDDDYEAV